MIDVIHARPLFAPTATGEKKKEEIKALPYPEASQTSTL